MDTFTLKTAMFVAAAVVAAASPADVSAADVNPAAASPPTSDLTNVGRAHPTSTVAAFELYGPDARAVTYDEQLVPTGADVHVSSWPSQNGSTTTLLSVHGLVPNRTYGSHVHSKRCGPDPNDSGPHFQHVPDPVQPSVDPAYANSSNEIWLDFTTNASGDASSVSTVPWQFTDGHAQSVVLHVDQTRTDPGHAGSAGARVGCVNVDF